MKTNDFCINNLRWLLGIIGDGVIMFDGAGGVRGTDGEIVAGAFWPSYNGIQSACEAEILSGYLNWVGELKKEPEIVIEQDGQIILKVPGHKKNNKYVRPSLVRFPKDRAEFKNPLPAPAGNESSAILDWPVFCDLLDSALHSVARRDVEGQMELKKVLWGRDGILTSTDSYGVCQGWVGVGLYDSDVTMSVSFVKALIQNKEAPGRWFSDGVTISAVWPDARWIQGPTNDGKKFREEIDLNMIFNNFDQLPLVHIPRLEPLVDGEDVNLIIGYDGMGSLHSPKQEPIKIDLGERDFYMYGPSYTKIFTRAEKWAFPKTLVGTGYWVGERERGAFLIAPMINPECPDDPFYPEM